MLSRLQPGVSKSENIFVSPLLDIQSSMNYIILKLEWQLDYLEIRVMPKQIWALTTGLKHGFAMAQNGPVVLLQREPLRQVTRAISPYLLTLRSSKCLLESLAIPDPPRAKNATPVVETSDDWLTDERVVYGMHARQVNTGQWIRGFSFVLSL